MDYETPLVDMEVADKCRLLVWRHWMPGMENWLIVKTRTHNGDLIERRFIRIDPDEPDLEGWSNV